MMEIYDSQLWDKALDNGIGQDPDWVNKFSTLFVLSCLLYCRTSVLGLGEGVDFTFAWDNNNDNNNNDNNDNNKNPHLNFLEMNSTRG